jgi:hypothetical protein
MLVRKLGILVFVTALVGCAGDASGDVSDGAAEAETAEASQELRHQALSRQQQLTALKLIDDICGDTWCEGDHNFSFDRLECQKGCGGRDGTCKLTFRVFSYDTDIETGPTYTRSCETSGFDGFGSLVRTQGTFQQLQPAYYDQLTECISRVEADLPD